MKKLIKLTIALEVMFILLSAGILFESYRNHKAIKQLWETNVQSCQWVKDQGMEPPAHCDPYVEQNIDIIRIDYSDTIY